jgi:hypothetical protein
MYTFSNATAGPVLAAAEGTAGVMDVDIVIWNYRINAGTREKWM